MTIKILGGLAKSRSLFIPKGNQTRPTSALLKRRIFDAYQSLEGHHFVDLCAGSGAMAFEAWSRGATQVTLIEVDKNALRALEQNLNLFKREFPKEMKERPIKLLKGRAEKLYEKTLSKENTIVFLDPPYENHGIYKDIGLNLLKNHSHCDHWIESDRQKGLPLSFWEDEGHEPDKVYSQGTSYLAVFKKS